MTGLIVYAMGSIFLLAGIKLWKDSNAIATNEEKVVGTIIDVEKERKIGDNSPVYHLDVYFTTRIGQKISQRLQISTNEKRRKGEKINLVYDSTDPYNVMEDSFGRRVLIPRIFTAIGLLLLVLGSLHLLDIIEIPFNESKKTEILF